MFALVAVAFYKRSSSCCIKPFLVVKVAAKNVEATKALWPCEPLLLWAARSSCLGDIGQSMITLVQFEFRTLKAKSNNNNTVVRLFNGPRLMGRLPA